MPQAIVDPDEVRRFAAFLDSMADALKSKKSGINSRFNELRDVWRDQKYSQFQRLFTETSIRLDQFLQQAQRYSHYLKVKAQKVDRYLEQRY